MKQENKQITKLKELEKEFLKTTRRMVKFEEYGDDRRIFLRYKKEAIDIRYEIYKILASQLERNDFGFNRIASSNYELLAQELCFFKTHKKSVSATARYSSKFTGRLKTNGLIYCKAIESSFPFFLPALTYSIPDYLVGKVNCIGTVELETASYTHGSNTHLPSTYTCKIEPNGKMIIRTDKVDLNSNYNTKEVITQIVGNPFHDDMLTLAIFYRNKRLLYEIMDEYRLDFRIRHRISDNPYGDF